MDKATALPTTFLTRMQSPSWQQQLRASVRLFLALGADPSLARACDELLQRTEAELLDFLLAGTPPSVAERQRAKYLLDLAQHALLDAAQQAGPHDEAAALERELRSIQQAQVAF